MSQGWPLGHVSETTKQSGAGKFIFVPSFLENHDRYTCYRCTIWVLLEWKVCAAMGHLKWVKKKQLKTNKDNLNEPIEKKSILISYAC